jgi:hypothetical protein
MSSTHNSFESVVNDIRVVGQQWGNFDVHPLGAF